jgi:hypothetical protein
MICFDHDEEDGGVPLYMPFICRGKRSPQSGGMYLTAHDLGVCLKPEDPEAQRGALGQQHEEAVWMTVAESMKG